MRNAILGVLIVAALIIAGCGERDLPPDPNPPGAIGQAGGGDNPQPQFPTDPRFTVDFNPLVVDEAQQSATQSISIDNQVIWHTAYYLSHQTTQAGEWVPFELTGQEPIQNWFKTDATGDYTFHTDFLYNDSIDWSAVIAYSCEKSDEEWYCHNNQWIIDMFDVVMSECTPGQSRCNADGSTLEECSQNHVWTTVEVCGAGLCYQLLGENQAWCGDCQIGETTCDGETGFLTCDEDGAWSGLVTPCNAPETCVNGACGFDLPSDPTAPSGQSDVLTITSPQSGGTLTQTNTISGEYMLDDNHIQSLTISVNGDPEALAHSSGGFAATVTIPTQGTTSIVVELTDAWGTSYTDSIQLTYGGVPVPYVITLDQVPSPTNANIIQLSGMVTDITTGQPASDVQVNIEYGGAVIITTTTDASGSFNVPITLTQSNHHYVITAVAIAGDGFPSEPAIIELWQVDQIMPTTVYPNTAGIYNTVEEIIIQAEQVDNAVLSIPSITLIKGTTAYNLGSMTVTSCGNNCMQFIMPILETLSDGTYTITYTIEDTLQSEQRTSTFTVDTTAPTITVINPNVFIDPTSEESINGWYTTLQSVEITGEITGVGINSAADIVSHNLDVVFDCGPMVCFNKIISLPYGTSETTLAVTDRQGRTGMRTLIFHTPVGPSEIYILEPQSGGTFTATNVIYGTYNADDALVQDIRLYLNGVNQGELDYMNGEFSGTVTCELGMNTIEVQLTDNWGTTYMDSIQLEYGMEPVHYLVDPIFLESPTNANMVTLEGMVLDLNTGQPAEGVTVEIDSEGSTTTTTTNANGDYTATMPLSQSNHHYIFATFAIAGDGFRSEPGIQELWHIDQILPTTVFPDPGTPHYWVEDIIIQGTRVDGAELSISEITLYDAQTFVQQQLGYISTHSCGEDCVEFNINIYTDLEGLPTGNYIISYTMADTLQTVQRMSTFTVDKTAPVIDIINPPEFTDPTSPESLNGLYVTEPLITVTGTVSGVGISDINDIEHHNFDSIFTCGAGSGICFNKDVWLPQGTSDVVLYVEDTQGRFGERVLIFHLQYP